MQRHILAFHQDAESHWVADLDCGHGQHMRHAPPWTVRPWVLDEAARAARVGQPIDCAPCDRAELPAGFAPYKRTADFTESTVPAGLLSEHRTKLGTWGRLHVTEGELDYVELEPEPRTTTLRAGEVQTIPTAMPHEVRVRGPVRFHVEFLRRGG